MNDSVFGLQRLIPSPHSGLPVSVNRRAAGWGTSCRAGPAREVWWRHLALRGKAAHHPLPPQEAALRRRPRTALARACPRRPRPPGALRQAAWPPSPPWRGPPPRTRRRDKPHGAAGTPAALPARRRRPGPDPHSPQQASQTLPTPRAAPPPCWGWVKRPAYGPRQGSNAAAAAWALPRESRSAPARAVGEGFGGTVPAPARQSGAVTASPQLSRSPGAQ